jgi:magnesium chelatase family protein
MSIARIRSFAFSGIEAVPVEVQVQIASGLPAFLVVGLPDKAVAEARERVRAALTAMGLSLPPRRVLINLAPADLLKEGSHFDLPIALAVLAAMEVLPGEELAEYAALGELSLDGALNPVAGVLPAAIAAAGLGLGLICPAAQGGEAAWSGGTEVLAAGELLALINHFRGTQVLTPPEPGGVAEPETMPDLADVRGMETAKRALEIAAAGGHNLLLVGPPGAGKSMLAARLPGLLPDLAPREALEVSMIHSVAGMLEGGRLLRRPPFREPHHSASQAALTGGGNRARPGEVSLAHRGVLFLDELPEFPRAALEALRQPLETGRTTIARAMAHVTYPARFQLIAAMNPCRCGHLGDASRECGRAPRCGEEYRCSTASTSPCRYSP